MLEVLLPRLVLDDVLVDSIVVTGDAAKIRSALAAWVFDVHTSVAGELEARAAAMVAEAPSAPVAEKTPDTIVDLRAAVAEVGTAWRNLRLAVMRGEVVDREASIARSEERRRLSRRRVEQIVNLSSELADARSAGREAVRSVLGSALAILAADVRAMHAGSGPGGRQIPTMV